MNQFMQGVMDVLRALTPVRARCVREEDEKAVTAIKTLEKTAITLHRHSVTSVEQTAERIVREISR